MQAAEEPFDLGKEVLDCGKCIVCCPCNFTVGCIMEIRDTCVYCAQCPHRCMEERRRKAKKRSESGLTRKEQYKQSCIKCCTPDPSCCGETPADKCVCCFISPFNWVLLCCFFFLFYLFIFSFWIGLMLIYLGIAGYPPTI